MWFASLFQWPSWIFFKLTNATYTTKYGIQRNTVYIYSINKNPSEKCLYCILNTIFHATLITELNKPKSCLPRRQLFLMTSSLRKNSNFIPYNCKSHVSLIRYIYRFLSYLRQRIFIVHLCNASFFFSVAVHDFLFHCPCKFLANE